MSISRVFSSLRLTTIILLFSVILFSSRNAGAEADDEQSIKLASSLSRAFERVAQAITPSVVNVSSIRKPKLPKTGRRLNPNDPFFDPFREFFGDDLFDRFQAPEDKGGQQGLGTGVIVSADGYIITNNHVVENADDVTIRMSEGKTVKAEVKGTDPKSDIAVLKIKDTSGLKSAVLGDSDKLKIGEWVVAVGNPFGLDNSITAGIVSAKGRSIMGAGQFEDFIQTDAAINPGNSGGPLVNLNGEVVGINTAIFSRSGGYMGIGFAIPINMARNVMESLITKGKVIRGWLGVSIQNLSEELSKSFSHSGTEGALVGQVQSGSPAERAGLKQGDIITSFKGQSVKNINQLRNVVAGTTPGERVEIDLIRDGKKKSVTAVIEELPASLSSEEEGPSTSQIANEIGVRVETLTQEIAQKLRSKRTSGVIVTQVDPGSIGDLAGLQPRDIIISVNNTPVNNVGEFIEAIDKQALQRGVRLYVETQSMGRYVFLRSSD